MNKKILLAAIIILPGLFLAGQEQGHEQELIKFPAQLTFIYPIGTHGMTSQKYLYNFSANILAGRTGAVEGFEAAGILNFNDKYFYGFQGAGIGNICGGTFNGFQGGGIFNLVARDFTGFQSAGITNINGGYLTGFQGAGIGNFSNGLEGIQMAGIVNINADSLFGAQAAGIANATEYIDGVQMAGIVNAAEEVKGGQISGVVNIAGYVNGFQIAGIINICDSIDGIPLGVISFVRKNGYRRIEVSTSEILVANVTYKTGVKRFYTLFSIGYLDKIPDYNLSFGFGIGTRFFGNEKKFALDLELRNNHLNKNFISENNAYIQSLILDYSRTLHNRLEIFAGPSVNMLVTPKSITSAKISPSWARALKSNNRIWGWAGFHAGIRF